MIRKIVSALTVLLVATGLAACSGSAEEQPTRSGGEFPTPPVREMERYTSAPEELIGPEEPSRGDVYIDEESMIVIETVSTLGVNQSGIVSSDALVFASDHSIWLEPKAEIYSGALLGTPNWLYVEHRPSGIVVEPMVSHLDHNGNLVPRSYGAYRSEPLEHSAEEMAALGYVRVVEIKLDNFILGQ